MNFKYFIFLLLIFTSCFQSGRSRHHSENYKQAAASNEQMPIRPVSSQNSISICSWNLKHFGNSNSDESIDFIANTIKDYDIIAIQEVVAGIGGPQAVARLNDALNRKGSKWDYSISAPTSGSPQSSERYAFIWKTSRLKKVGKAWLDKNFDVEIQREPYLITMSAEGEDFTLVNFHAIPRSKQPETEIKYFKYFPDNYESHRLIFAGDFNIPQSHSVFNPLLSMGFVPVLKGQKTSLRQKCLNNDCLASELDNIFYNKFYFQNQGAGIIPFYQAFDELKYARAISDHVPVFFKFTFLSN